MLIEQAVNARQVGAPTARVVDDELARVVATVCAKYPRRSRAEVTAVVECAYRQLAERATLRTHLIPLTLNRSLRQMRESGD